MQKRANPKLGNYDFSNYDFSILGTTNFFGQEHRMDARQIVGLRTSKLRNYDFLLCLWTGPETGQTKKVSKVRTSTETKFLAENIIG